MKELYNAPELEIVTFVPVEELAAGYLDGYARAIGASTRSGDTSDVDVDLPIYGDQNGEGSPY